MLEKQCCGCAPSGRNLMYPSSCWTFRILETPWSLHLTPKGGCDSGHGVINPWHDRAKAPGVEHRRAKQAQVKSSNAWVVFLQGRKSGGLLDGGFYKGGLIFPSSNRSASVLCLSPLLSVRTSHSGMHTYARTQKWNIFIFNIHSAEKYLLFLVRMLNCDNIFSSLATNHCVTLVNSGQLRGKEGWLSNGENPPFNHNADKNRKDDMKRGRSRKLHPNQCFWLRRMWAQKSPSSSLFNWIISFWSLSNKRSRIPWH